jgi:hypothetical protein
MGGHPPPELHCPAKYKRDTEESSARPYGERASKDGKGQNACVYKSITLTTASLLALKPLDHPKRGMLWGSRWRQLLIPCSMKETQSCGCNA